MDLQRCSGSDVCLDEGLENIPNVRMLKSTEHQWSHSVYRHQLSKTRPVSKERSSPFSLACPVRVCGGPDVSSEPRLSFNVDMTFPNLPHTCLPVSCRIVVYTCLMIAQGCGNKCASACMLPLRQQGCRGLWSSVRSTP